MRTDRGWWILQAPGRQVGSWLQTQWFGAQALGLDPDPASPAVCDLEQVSGPTGPSVFLATYQGQGECYQPHRVNIKVKFVNACNAPRMVSGTEKALNQWLIALRNSRAGGPNRQTGRNQWWLV